MRDDPSRPPIEAIPITDAAARLGVSPEAIRKRIARGSLTGEKRGGVWYVLLPDAMSGQLMRQSGRARRPDASGQPDAASGHAELIAELRSRVAFLEERVIFYERQVEHQAGMLADLARRVPELPAGRPEGTTVPTPEQTHSAPQTAVTPPPRRPWWRRLFGG